MSRMAKVADNVKLYTFKKKWPMMVITAALAIFQFSDIIIMNNI